MTHKVQPQETLYHISKQYGVTIAEIMVRNNLQSEAIRIGQELIIPEKGQIAQESPLSASGAFKITLHRFEQNDRHSLGKLGIWQSESYKLWNEVFQCKTLELPWKQNLKKESCIPNGVYPVILEYSEHFKQALWEIKQVPDRSEVKIHIANRASELLGCIAIGKEFTILGNEKVLTDSAETLKEFHSVLDGQKYLTIEIKCL